MNKKLLSFALTLTAMTAAAQDNSVFYFEYDDATQTATVTYNRDEDGNMKGGTYSGDVVIPAKAPNGYTVTTIGEYAFYKSNTMTSLTIPPTIDSIGRRPFEGCDAHLTRITIEDTDRLLRTFALHYWAGREMVFGGQGIDLDVKEAYIGRPFRTAIDEEESRRQSIFLSNDSLRTATLGDWYEEVPDGLFEDCDSLRTVHFSPNTKRIGKETFWSCEALSSMDLPKGLETIDEKAFGYCKFLGKITLPQTLKLISSDAFMGCEQLASITIPASVDSIGCAFNGCKALRSFTVENGNMPLRFWSQHSWAGWSTVFDGMENLETVTMGRPVICDIPSTYYCRNLRKFEYTYPIDEVADKQFYHCTNLRSVIFCGAPTRIGKEAFRECDSLVSINLPEGVTFIDDHAFYYCLSLEHVGLPSTLSVIGDYAFRRCEQFRRFTIPAQVDSICNGILNECTNLKTVIIAPSSKPLKYCCPSQFTNSLRAATIDTLYLDRYIQNGALSDNQTLKKLYIGSNVTALCEELFGYCYNIDEIFSLNPVPPTCEGGRVFAYVNKEDCRLHVPIGSLDAYKEAFVWQDFFNRDEVDGVNSTKAEAATVADSYTLGGQRTTGAQRGLIIQRMSDGTARKVMMK